MADSRGGGGLSEETKLWLHGLHAQAKNGPLDPEAFTRKPSEGAQSNGLGSALSPSSSSSLGLGVVTDLHEGEGVSLRRSYSSPPAVESSESSDVLNPDSSKSFTTGVLSRSMSQDQDQLEIFRDCACLSQESAMRSFLGLLFSLAPYWKYEQFI